jgi:G protein-coupled receptor 107
MTVLVALKTIALFAESMRFYYMKRHGDTLTSWTAVYYVFMFLKGVMLFIVVLLIGTGWSLLKSHLSRRDKSIISIVLVLQVFSNTAMIVMEESAVGTRKWVTWRDVLHIMDILCCFAILFPIVWSIRSLRESAFTDGKAHINLQKLVQFRSFYLSVVTYIYVTRIALFLLAASLPYNATWISVVVGEGAALVFFTLTGYRFRPLDQNPYLEVSTRIDSLDEFGLDDDDLEIQGVPIQRKDHLRLSMRPPSPRKTNRLAL